MASTTWFKDYNAVHQLIKYKPDIPFSEEVGNARRKVNKDPLKKQLGDVAKLKGNSFYGKMIEDLGRHKSTKFTVRKWLLTRPLGPRSLTI